MIKLPVKYDADAHEILDADGRWCTTREDAEEMAVALNAHTELSTRLAEYEEMLGEAERSLVSVWQCMVMPGCRHCKAIARNYFDKQTALKQESGTQSTTLADLSGGDEQVVEI